MSDDSSSNGCCCGCGCGGVFTIFGAIFVVLKLLGLIDWSWIWVLSPIWIGIIVNVILWAIMIAVVFVAALIANR